jgi:hypothetical protein
MLRPFSPSLRLGPSAVRAALALAALSLAGQAAHASTVTDPAGDFLSTYTGPHNGDMDAISASAFDDGTNVTLSATLNGAIGTTPTGFYVFGIDRGGGLPLLTFSSPAVGAGVNFDAVAVLIPGGGSFVDVILPTAETPVSLTDVTFSGSGFTAVIPLADLPSNGFTPDHFLYNLWPRDGIGTMNNDQIPDFAPDATDFAASVPEPATWGLLMLGFGLAGGALRSRRRERLAAV